MRIKKIISRSFDVENPIALVVDTEQNLLQSLRNLLNGTCYDGCFIHDVTKVLRYFDRGINNIANNVFSTYDVQFEVDAEVFPPKEIINLCKVMSRDKNGTVLCGKDNVSFYLNAHGFLKTVTPGNLISVRVKASRYTSGDQQVSITGYPFIPAMETPEAHYINSADWTPEEIALISNLKEKLAGKIVEYDEIKKKNAKGIKFFEDMLYPYKSKMDVTSGQIINFADAKDINGWVYRDPRIPIQDPLCVLFKKEPENVSVSGLTPAEGYIDLLDGHFNNLRTIIELFEYFNTEEKLKLNMIIWSIYKNLKKQS